MKERPILFSGPMVRAILEGRKTQTRRVMKPQPPSALRDKFPHPRLRGDMLLWCEYADIEWPCWDHHMIYPHGVPGDRLWVRETWTPDEVDMDAAKQLGRAPVHYRADGEAPDYLRVKWRPPIFMPRWASRITLEVTEVRVQQVQEISKDDISEGVYLGAWVWAITFKRVAQEK